jgi:hypothetical protein
VGFVRQRYGGTRQENVTDVGGKIVAIDLIADHATLDELDLAILTD